MHGLQPFYRYFEFHGRSGRAEYWQFVGIYVLGLIIAYVLDLALSGPYATPVLTIIVWLAGIIPAYSVGVRRLHDRDRTGRWLLLQAALSITTLVIGAAAAQAKYTALGDILLGVSRIPSIANLILSVFLLVQLVQRGTDGDNRYGADPLREPSLAPSFADLAAKAQSAASAVQGRATAAPQRPSNDDPLQQIERLAKLRDAGTLTEEEFQAQKAVYLSRLS